MDLISSPAEDESRPARRRPWLSHAAMIVVGLLLGATGIAVAADETPSAKTSPSSAATADEDDAKGQAKVDDKAGDKNRRGGPGAKNKGTGNKTRKHLLRGGPRGALHGEFVVPAGDDTFQTLAVQRGKVTAVSATSITLRSDDGYSATYAITGDTRVKAHGGGIESIVKASDVHVVAVRKGDRLTAQLVHDRGAPGQARDKPKPKPSPTTSGTGG